MSDAAGIESRTAAAQSAKITGNDYDIEVFQGPILAPGHVVGVGGAYVASAEGSEGTAVNSAAPAVRDPFSVDWLDYDVSVGASIPGAFARTDFDNRGDYSALPHARAGDFVDVNFGGILQLGALGIGATGDLQQFSLSEPTSQGEPGLTMRLGRWKLLAAYGLFDGQLVVGGGARIATMDIRDDAGTNLLTMTGVAPEAGALVMPTGRPWRVGATVRAPVQAGIFRSGDNVSVDDGGVRSAGSFVLPQHVVMPWEAEVGVAYQLGPRPLNPGWRNPHEQEAWLRNRIRADREARAASYQRDLATTPAESRDARKRELDAQDKSLRAIEDERLDAESQRLRKVRAARYDNWPRDKILLLASVLATGTNSQAVSVEGFLDQRAEYVGRSVSWAPRLGMEGEPVRERLRLRVGTYVEPSRYDDGSARQHFTFGADVKLFPIEFWGLLPPAVWKAGVFLDVAPRYANGGIGIGNWH